MFGGLVKIKTRQNSEIDMVSRFFWILIEAKDSSKRFFTASKNNVPSSRYSRIQSWCKLQTGWHVRYRNNFAGETVYFARADDTLARTHARTLARSRGTMSKFSCPFLTIVQCLFKAMHNMVTGLRPVTMYWKKFRIVNRLLAEGTPAE